METYLNREQTEAQRKASVLIEALPYIQKFNRKIVVIKYGGSAMNKEELQRNVIKDVTLLKLVGFKPIIVHGGGKAISKWVEKSGKEASGVGSKIHQVDVIESSEEYETNTEWSEQEVEETTYYEEYTTWVEDDDQVASSAYAEASDYEPSVSESVMWTGEMETSDETQVAETFISEQYEVMPSIG